LIETKLDQLVTTTPIDDATIALGLSGLIAHQNESIVARCPSTSLWSAKDGFQLSGERELDWDFIIDGENQNARLRFDELGISVLSKDNQWVSPALGGHVFQDGDKTYVLNKGRQSIFQRYTYELEEEGNKVGSNGEITVPMHGKIISITVTNGDQVEEGDILFSVEAMKMEHAVLAPIDGVIEAVAIESGAQVEAGFVALRVSSE
jgi:3-methylcrotonyl-CoA carboxylase alpha subunit